MKQNIYILILAIFLPLLSEAQQKKVAWQDGKRDLLQFSGVVVEGDSLRPIPYASIIVQNSYRGTVSD